MLYATLLVHGSGTKLYCTHGGLTGRAAGAAVVYYCLLEVMVEEVKASLGTISYKLFHKANSVSLLSLH